MISFVIAAILLPFLIASLCLREQRESRRRTLCICSASMCGVSLVVAGLLGEYRTIPALISFDPVTSKLGILLSAITIALTFAAPTRAFDAVGSERVNILLGLVNLLLFTDNLALFVLGWLASWWIISRELVRRDQERRNIGSASATYIACHCIAAVSLFGLLAESCYSSWVSREMAVFSIDALSASSLASNSFAFIVSLIPVWIAFGMAPIHFWMSHFLVPTRCTGSLLLSQLAGSGIALVRVVDPLSSSHPAMLEAVGVLGAMTILYFALVMFRETHLPRATLYLYLSQVALLFITFGVAEGERGVLALHLTNLIVGASGMVLVITMLHARIGAERISSIRGCAHLLPHAAVCFLISALSLVCFPGTLGFLLEEGIVSGALSHHLPIVSVVVVALALNGYSAMRVFGGVFLGPKDPELTPQLSLLPRERLGAVALATIVILAGMVPGLIASQH